MNSTNKKPSATGGGHTFRNDLLLIGGLLTVVILAGLCLFVLRGEGDTVTVTVDGKPYAH